MVFYSEKDIKKMKSKMVWCIVIDVLFWLIFLSLFIPFAFLVDDSKILVFKIVSSISLIISSWVTIFIFSSPFPTYSSKKKTLESSFLSQEEKIEGIIVSIGEIRTITKGFRGKEIEISGEDKRRILILSEEKSEFEMKEGEKYILLIRDSLIVGVEE